MFLLLVRTFATIPFGRKECVIRIGIAGMVSMSSVDALLCKLVIVHHKVTALQCKRPKQTGHQSMCIPTWLPTHLPIATV
jgi:hypothetical protein